MKNIFILTAFLLLSSELIAQKFFEIGTDYMLEGNYAKAEPYLSTSIKNRETETAYYNRALCRIYLDNLEGACEDLVIMSTQFNDPESMVLYNRHCCNKVDTTYLNRKFSKSEKNRYLYYEELKYPIFRHDTVGFIRKKCFKYENFKEVFGDPGYKLPNKKTNIYAKYYLLNKQRIYTYIRRKKPSLISESIFLGFANDVKATLLEHYPYLQKDNQVEDVTIKIDVIISPSGEIYKVRNVESLINSKGSPLIIIRDETKKVITNLILSESIFKPIIFNKTGIYYDHSMYLRFKFIEYDIADRYGSRF